MLYICEKEGADILCLIEKVIFNYINGASLYQQIGLKFEEETSKMLHLEYGFLWC